MLDEKYLYKIILEELNEELLEENFQQIIKKITSLGIPTLIALNLLAGTASAEQKARDAGINPKTVEKAASIARDEARKQPEIKKRAKKFSSTDSGFSGQQLDKGFQDALKTTDLELSPAQKLLGSSNLSHRTSKAIEDHLLHPFQSSNKVKIKFSDGKTEDRTISEIVQMCIKYANKFSAATSDTRGGEADLKFWDQMKKWAKSYESDENVSFLKIIKKAAIQANVELS